MSDDRANDHKISRGQLVASGTGGEESTVPVLLRQGGLSRIGAVYVGQQSPPLEGRLSLVDERGVAEEVRLVRSKRSAEYVFLLGLEASESSG